MSEFESDSNPELQAFDQKLAEFFRVAGGIVLANGLLGLADVVGGYADYNAAGIPNETRSAMAIFEQAVRERIQQERASQ